MTDLLKQLQALVPLAKAATAGPWEVIPNSEHTDSVHSTEANHVENFGLDEFRSSNLCMNTGGFSHNSDAALIVAARNLLTPENLAALCAALAPQWVAFVQAQPFHKSDVLLCREQDKAVVLGHYLAFDQWNRSNMCVVGGGFNTMDKFTHWMPLPTPPATMEGAQPNV